MSSKKFNKRELFLRLERMRDYYGLSQSAMSRKLGISSSYYSDMKVDKRGTGPSAQVVISVYREFKNVNFDWFVTGDGEMIVDKYVREESAPYYNRRDDLADLFRHIEENYDDEKKTALVKLIQGLLVINR